MECKKCGAKIPQGNVYCSVCGNEVQLVPDYNFLDEDVLGNLAQGKAQTEETLPAEQPIKQKTAGKRKKITVLGVIFVVILAASLTLLLVYQDIKKKNENSYTFQYQKAEECMEAEEWEDAVSYLKRALEIKKNDRRARERLLEIYLEREDMASALPILEGFAREGKIDRADVKILIGIYSDKEEYDKILDLYEEAGYGEWSDLFEDYLVERPRFSSISGTYGHSLDIEISTKNGYEIFYTTDGRDPVSHGRPYHTSIVLKKEGTTALSAVSRNEKGIYSEIVKAEYTIKYEPLPMPKVEPAGGTYTEPQRITVQVPPDCVAYYTWDGSDPVKGSAKYTGPLEMPPGNQVLSVILINSVGLRSCVYRVNYIYMP